MTDEEEPLIDYFQVLASGGWLDEKKHEGLAVAEENCEMTKAQFAKVFCLRLEQAIRYRDMLSSNEFYRKGGEQGGIDYWEGFTWSAALYHAQTFEQESEIPLFLRDYLQSNSTGFPDTDFVMAREDGERLLQLAKGYKAWLREQLPQCE